MRQIYKVYIELEDVDSSGFELNPKTNDYFFTKKEYKEYILTKLNSNNLPSDFIKFEVYKYCSMWAMSK